MIKKFRFFIQLIFFLVTILIFFGIFQKKEIIDLYHSLHVFPSLSSLAWLMLPPFFLLTVFMLLLPFIMGRVYCSFLCPVGFIQDLSFKLSKKLKIKSKRVLTLSFIRISLLFLCLGLLFFRSSSYGYLDHISNWGRLLVLHRANTPFVTVYALFFLFIISILPLLRPRWFCNTICPTGTLFSVFQKHSFLTIKTNNECTHCNICEKKCPVSCIHGNVIDWNQCISCYECLESCPRHVFSLDLRNPFKNLKKNVLTLSHDRRLFLISIPSLLFGIISARIVKSRLFDKNSAFQTIIPPGGKSSEQFFNRCVSCNLCVSVCPTKVIVLSNMENDLPGLAKPMMDYDKSYCAYECNTCLSVCPTEALTYYPLPQKKQIKIGSIELNKTLCIPYSEGRDCSACAEHCPTGAILTERRENVYVPITNNDYCIGCGTCQWICPVRPVKAIHIKPEEIHKVSYNPRLNIYKKEFKVKEVKENDFPF